MAYNTPAAVVYNLPDEGTIVAPPVASSWTSYNLGGGTTFTNSGNNVQPTVYLQTTEQAGSVRGKYVATAGSTYTTTARMKVNWIPLGSAGGNQQSGMMITDGTANSITFGIIVFYEFTVSSPAARVGLAIGHWTSTTPAYAYEAVIHWSLADGMWLQIHNDGTTRSYNVSVDGVNFLTYFSEPAGTFLTETSIGIANVSNTNQTGTNGLTLDSWKNVSP
jgi:hypothetical protein